MHWQSARLPHETERAKFNWGGGYCSSAVHPHRTPLPSGLNNYENSYLNIIIKLHDNRIHIMIITTLSKRTKWTFCYVLVFFCINRTDYKYICLKGRRMIGISGSLIWSKTLMELIFDACGEFRLSPEGPVSQIHSPHLHVGAPWIFSDL